MLFAKVKTLKSTLIESVVAEFGCGSERLQDRALHKSEWR